MDDTKTVGNGGMIFSVAIGLLVGFFIGGWIWPGNGIERNPKSIEDKLSDTEIIYDESDLTDTSDSGNDVLSSASDSIIVASQGAGTTVTVDKVVVDGSAWLVIHEDREGAPGNILGARRLFAGTAEGVSVELLRGTSVGKIYYAMIHADNGDQTFDYKSELPEKDENGNVIMTTFKVE